MSRAESIAERNLAHEVAAVTEGHHAFVADGGAIEVVSDSVDGKRFRVTFRDGGPAGVVFTCQPTGARAFESDHGNRVSVTPGSTPCKHSALAARRLEREGLVVNVDGVWFTAPAAEAAPAMSEDDAFRGFA